LRKGLIARDPQEAHRHGDDRPKRSPQTHSLAANMGAIFGQQAQAMSAIVLGDGKTLKP